MERPIRVDENQARGWENAPMMTTGAAECQQEVGRIHEGPSSADRDTMRTPQGGRDANAVPGALPPARLKGSSAAKRSSFICLQSYNPELAAPKERQFSWTLPIIVGIIASVPDIDSLEYTHAFALHFLPPC